MPSRYSTSYDYDSTLDSPTVRSSISNQPMDDDHIIVADYASDVSGVYVKGAMSRFLSITLAP